MKEIALTENQGVVVGGLSPLVQAAMSGTLQTDMLKQLLEIQKDYEKYEAEKAFHLALSEFKKNDLSLYKDKLVSFKNKAGGTTEYRHTTLGAALAEINPMLGENGLSLTWETQQGEGGRITVTAILSHSKGFSKKTSLSGAPDDSGGKNNIQAVGSTVSYLERYTAFSLLGVASMDMDTDGRVPETEQAAETQDRTIEVPPYPQDRFDKNLNSWVDLVVNGDKTVEEIIKTVSTKGILSDAQKQKLKLACQTTDEWSEDNKAEESDDATA